MPLPTTSSAGGMGSPPPSGAGGTSTSSSNHVHHAQGNHHLQGHSEKKSSSRQSREEQRLARRLFQIQDRSLTVLRVLFVIGIPLTIINISFACAYAWLFANQYAYTKDDWQRCLIYPNQGVDVFGNHAEDKTNYLMAAASYAGRVFVFIIVVFKMAYVGVKDTDILPYALFTNMMALLGIIVYREAEPIQPQPQQLSATLLTLIKYIHPHMYDFPDATAKWAPSSCAPAYHLNKWFLIFQIMVVVLVASIFVVVATCAVANYKEGKRWRFQLQGNAYPLGLLVVAFAGYVTCFYAKETVAQLTLDVLSDSNMDNFFVFSKGELDIVSLTMMMTLGAIGVGTCKGDLEKFKLGAFISYIHVVLSYPSILATFHGFNGVTYPFNKDKSLATSFDIWSMDSATGCPAYISTRSSIFARDQGAAHKLCRMCHLSLVGQLIQFCAQHLVVVACLYILYANRDLPAQRLRLGTYVPDYLGGVHVNVSVHKPIAGFRRNHSRFVVDGGKKGGKGGAGAGYYARLPGGPEEEEEVGGGGMEEGKKGGGRETVAAGV